ncbi:undecaprenyl-diphosphate phosphatase [Candidatus Shapirobacteria bacterium]|nr:undecaprenyl-diphosphate phosphatase [Candidatus Shapirobacteria bacterium]
MSILHAIILSLIQGISEFLPISSTGHLHLFQYFLGITPSLTFDIFLNTASLLSVLFFFRNQTKYFFNNLLYIIVGTIPAVLVGLLFKSQLETIFANNSLLWSQFLFSGIALFLTRYIKPKDEKMTFGKALIIGIFQALAIIPAISRSGSTIFAGLLLGLSPLAAFNFSFSLFIPASIGALVLDIKDLVNMGALTPVFIFSFILTFLVGVVALSYLKKVLLGRHFWLFGIYMLLLSLFCYIVL